jgi:2-enoate reductase
VENAKVVTAIDLLLGRSEAGESVAVIGGGQIGCETALYLAQQGKTVTVIELLEGVARDLYSANRIHLLKLLDEARVTILTERKTLKIADEGITITDKHDRRTTLAAHSIVLAVGLQSNTGLWEAVKGKVPELHMIGDCVEPRKVLNAIWEGFRIARLV